MIWLIFLLGSFLRVWNLFSGKSIWSDEVFSMTLAKKPIGAVIDGAIQDVHPPLYYIILHLFSYNELTMRLVSVLSGIGLIYTVYLLGKELFDEKVALLASFLVAISPYFIQSSNEIRSYSLLAFVVTLSTYFYFKGLKIWFVVMALTSIYTEHFSWFWFIGIFGLSFVSKSNLKACFYAFFLGLPSLWLIGYQTHQEGLFQDYRLLEYMNFAVVVKKIAGVFWHFGCGYRYSMLNFHQFINHWWDIPILTVSIYFALLIFFLMARGINNILSDWLCGFLAWWLLAPIVILGICYPIRLDARYLSFCAPAFYLALAYGLSSKTRKWAVYEEKPRKNNDAGYLM